jgi:hypothetical protein
MLKADILLNRISHCFYPVLIYSQQAVQNDDSKLTDQIKQEVAKP